MKCCIFICLVDVLNLLWFFRFYVDMWNILSSKRVYLGNIKGLKVRGFCCWRKIWLDILGLIYGKGRREW